ncbi:MAG: hypothetical protein IT376_18820 [Polyangiaceae bacterium]|nr:hypothetical protein [Polyangiaceae bacterium]
MTARAGAGAQEELAAGAGPAPLPPFGGRPLRIALAAALAALGASGFVPLFGGPGYEAALAAGLVVPALAALATHAEVRRGGAPLEALGRGLANGAALFVVVVVVALAHGVRVGFCDATGGLTLLALGPGVGALLGGAWGATTGALVPAIDDAASRSARLTRGALHRVAPLGAPAAGICVSLWRFWSSPMVFALDPLFGWFAGPLYDTVIDGERLLLTYRAGSVASLVAIAAAAVHLRRDAAGRVGLARSVRPGVLVAGALGAALSLAVTASGPALGHWSTDASIRDALGRRVEQGRCEVVHSRDVRPGDARLVALECERHLVQLEAYFEARGPERVTVFLFASAGEKGALMGASTTYIAKPWRREVYVQAAGYPHPVLGHELAHVVAGAFGASSFRVAGPAGGWLPDPGRIEGFATAAAPDADDDLDPQRWAAAMKSLGLLPRLGSLFTMDFLGVGSSRAYMVAGAFVGWLRERHGAGAARRWYAGEPLERVTGRGLEALEQEWLASLDTQALGPAELAVARARFDRPAIFARRCPRVVDRLDGAGHGRLGAGDTTGAREAFGALLALDAGHFGARAALGTCALRDGDEPAARAALEALAADPAGGEVQRTIAAESLADLALAAGEPGAADRYLALLGQVAGEDRLRTIEVKLLAAKAPAGSPERKAIVELLVGDPRRQRDPGAALAALGEWAASAPDDGLPQYLIGRTLLGGGLREEAAARLDRALALTLALPRIRAEALRLRLHVACALGDSGAARRALDAYLAAGAGPPARREGTRRFGERCLGAGAGAR